MKKYGKEIDSTQAWNNLAKDYASKMNNNYHVHRLSVIRALYSDINFQGKKFFDFGCGNGGLIIELMERGGGGWGVDISAEMVSIARQNLKKKNLPPDCVKHGDVSVMKTIPSNSLDFITSFNVLAYLNKNEIEEFYLNSSRTLLKGGQLIVTHSNELFDMYTLNSYTVKFFAKHFYNGDEDSIAKLIENPDEPKITTYNVRANPLNYKYIMKKYGFSEVQQEFANLHLRSPLLLSDKDYPNTLCYSDIDKWKLMFMCSIYGSLLVKL